MTTKTTTITISGPGVDRDAPNEGAAVSGALTYACLHHGPATFYVRRAGVVRFLVERDEQRNVTVREVL